MTTGQFKHGTRLRISASAENYQSDSIIYTVDKDDANNNVINKSIQLTRTAFTITIIAKNKSTQEQLTGISISIDGIAVNNNVQAVSQGSHVIKVFKSGFGTVTETVNVTQDQTINIEMSDTLQIGFDIRKENIQDPSTARQYVTVNFQIGDSQSTSGVNDGGTTLYNVPYNTNIKIVAFAINYVYLSEDIIFDENSSLEIISRILQLPDDIVIDKVYGQEIYFEYYSETHGYGHRQTRIIDIINNSTATFDGIPISLPFRQQADGQQHTIVISSQGYEDKTFVVNGGNLFPDTNVYLQMITFDITLKYLATTSDTYRHTDIGLNGVVYQGGLGLFSQNHETVHPDIVYGSRIRVVGRSDSTVYLDTIVYQGGLINVP